MTMTRPASVEMRGDTLVITYGGWATIPEVSEPASDFADIDTGPTRIASHANAVRHYACCWLGLCAGSRRNYDGNGHKAKTRK